MVDVLQSLIDKQDSFEIVRDQIAALLVAETANQVQLAIDGGKDPELWKLKIFIERSNPWSQYQERDFTDIIPIVNVSYQSSTFDKTKGNVSRRQQAQGRFNIDIVAVGVSKDDGNGGHTAGDKDAALNLARAIRLVRNILMAGQNRHLQLQGLVGERWPQTIEQFQPEGDTSKNFAASRFVLAVEFNEFSPQFEPENLESIGITIFDAVDGEVLIEAEYLSTPAP